MSRRNIWRGAVAVGAIIGLVAVGQTALADDNPATRPLTHTCTVSPATDKGSSAGLPLVAQGETVTLSQLVQFDAGTIYQDIFERADGSVYYASVVELDYAGASGITIDPATATATLGGAPLATTPGTAPSGAGFVIDTSTTGVIRLYFPGDVTAMLADPTGHGVLSQVVPVGGAAIELRVSGTATATAPGTQLTAGRCYASVSTGPSNRNTTIDPGTALLAGLAMAVDKSADRAVASAGSEVTYQVRVDVPKTDASGLAVGPVFDAVVTDTLPAGLTVVPGSISHDGAVSAGTITWTLPVLQPGSTTILTFRAVVAGDAAAEITNDVHVVGTGLPGASDSERSIAADDDATVTISGDGPTITKQADVESAPIGATVTYEVTVSVPAGAPYYDVAIVDLLPDGVLDATAVSLDCTGCPGSDPAIADLGPQLADRWELGWFLGDLAASPDVRDYTIVYTVVIADTHLDGGPVVAGDALDNLAEVVWNDTDQLVGPAGLIDRSGWSGSRTATDTVTVGVPQLSIQKTVDNAAAYMPFPDTTTATWLTYRVRVTNTGVVDAYDIRVTDELDEDTPRPVASGVVVTSPSGSVTDHAYTESEPWIDWSYAGPLAPGESLEWVVQVRVSAGTSVTDPFTNTATITHLEDELGTAHAGPDPVVRDVNFGLPLLTPVKTLLTPAAGVIAPGDVATWRVVVTNTGQVTANRFKVCDSPEGGYTTYVTGSVSGASISAPVLMSVPPCDLGFTVSQPLAPGASYTFTYQTRIPASATGSYDNTVTTGPYLFGNAYTGTFMDVQVGGSDDASVTVTTPALTINKTPKAAQNIPIIQGQTGAYQIVVTNPSAVDAVTLVLTDVLPDQLSYPGGVTASAAPLSPAPVITPSAANVAAGGTLSFTIDRLAAGQSVTITIPVQHSGASVADYPVQTNVATLTGPGIPGITSEGVLYPQTLVAPPEVVKSVDLAQVTPGETVEFTADVTVPNNTDDVFDVTVVDTMADGFTPASPFVVDIECIAGSCVTPVGSVELGTPMHQPDGSWRFNAFIGDVPANSGEFTYRFTYSAVLDVAFEGTGTPGDGTLVLAGGLGVPVVNTMVPRFNYVDALSGVPSVFQTFTGRGYSDTADVVPLTPNVILTKTSAKTSIEVGDTNTYTITLTNTGTGTATHVVVTDDAANGALRDLVLDPANPVAPTDGWSLADPDLEWIVPSIPAGATVTLRYTAQSVPSSELVSSGASYDAMRVVNNAAVTEFTGGSVVYAPPRTDDAIVYVHTPRADVYQTTSAINCPVADQGEVWQFGMFVSNPATSTGLPTNIAPLRDVVVEEHLVPGLQYNAGSTVMSGSSILPAGAREPQVISNPDGSTTLRWIIPSIPANLVSPTVIRISATVIDASLIPDGGNLALVVVAGEDATGESSRGTTSGQAYAYTDEFPAGCVVPPVLEKEPTLRGGTVNDTAVPYVDPGQTWVWDTTLQVNGQALNGVVLTDTLPAGVTYVSSVFTPVSPAGAPLAPTSETVTPLPDGRTQIALAYPGTLGPDITYVLDMTTTIDEDAPANLELVNSIVLTADETLFGTGCDPDTHCSTGTVRTRPDGEPSLTKTVIGDASQLFGSTFQYELDIMIPKDRAFDDLVVWDALNAARTAPGGVTGTAYYLQFLSTVSATCYQGCAVQPSIGQTSVWQSGIAYQQNIPASGTDQANVAWVIEDAFGSNHLSAHTEDRYVRIVFEAKAPSAAPSGTGAAAVNFTTQNNATLAYSTNPAYNVNRIQPFWLDGDITSGRLIRADRASAVVQQYQPMPYLTKACWDEITGQQIPANTWNPTDTFDDAALTPSPVGIPNLRCEVTVSYSPHPEITDGIYDILVEDYIASSGGDFAGEGEFIGYGTTVAEAGNVSIDGSAIPTVDREGAGDPGRWTIDHLLPGESATVTMLYRLVNATESQGLPLAIALVDNFAQVKEYALTEGATPVASNVQQSFTILLHRPVVDVAKRLAPGTQPGLSADTPREAIVGEPVTYEVRVDITQQGDQRYITLTDSLPVGWEYVPGSATVKGPGTAWTSASIETGDFEPVLTPLFEPVITASSDTCLPADDNPGGPGLAWSFDRDDAARDQLWDETLLFDLPLGDFGVFRAGNDLVRTTNQSGAFVYVGDPVEWDYLEEFAHMSTYAGLGLQELPAGKRHWAWATGNLSTFQYGADLAWENGESVFFETSISSLYIQYQAVPTLDALDCIPEQGVAQDFVNEAQVTLQRIDSTTPDSATASFVTPLSGPLTIDKTPDDGTVVDGATAWFTITVANDTGRDLTDVLVRDDLLVDDPDILYTTGTFTAEPATGVTETALTAISGGQRIDFTVASLPDGASVVIRVPVTVPEGTADLTGIDNLATVITPDYPEEPSDEGSITVHNPAPAPDVTKTMVSAGATPGLLTGAPGEPFTATATMVVPAGDAFFDLAATDVLPDGLRFVNYLAVTCAPACPAFTATPASPQHDVSTGRTSIGWWFGDLAGSPVERTFTFTYSVAIANTYADGTPVEDGDALTNTITAMSNDSDRVDDSAAPTTPSNPGDFDFTSDDPGEASVLVRTPQLVLDKVASTPGPLAAGDTVTFTVTIENVGTGTAYRVPVVDLPSAATASVSYGSGSAQLVDPWSSGDPDIRWIVASLAPGATAEFVYTVTVRDDVQALGLTELANLADVEPYRARPNRLPGDTLFDGVPPVEIHIPLVGSDLSIQKFAGDACAGETVTFVPGDDVEFCIVVTNPGNDAASNVTLTDIPAAGFTYVASSATVQVDSDAAAAVEPTSTPTGDIVQLTWALGTIEPGTTVRVRYTLATDPSASGTLPNTARVVSTMPSGDPWPFNTRGTDSDDGAAAIALAASQEISKLPDLQSFEYDPVAGNTVVWQIIVTNPNSAPLTDLVVVDSLPIPFEFVSLTDAGVGGTVTTGEHSADLGDTATWTWAGPLPTGEERVLEITAHLPAGLDIDEVSAASIRYQNEVSLATDQIPVPVENTALATPFVEPAPEEPGTPTLPGLPNTGSTPLAVLPMSLALLLAGGLLVALVAWRSRRRRA